MLKSSNYQQVWDSLWKLYRATNVACEKEVVLLSLGCVNNERMLKR